MTDFAAKSIRNRSLADARYSVTADPGVSPIFETQKGAPRVAGEATPTKRS
jgi:hypothetical protein